MKNLKYIIAITALLLSIPLLLQWPWGLLDFVFMGILIFAAGTSVDLALRKVKGNYRYLAALAVLAFFLAIWAELAVDAVSRALSWVLG